MITIPFLNPDSKVDSSEISSKNKQDISDKDLRLSLHGTLGQKFGPKEVRVVDLRVPSSADFGPQIYGS